MLKNYFKIALAVFKRNKFFTFISLFGISFTLTILLVLTAFVDKVFNDSYPDKKRDRLLYINRLEQRGKESMMSGTLSYYFLNHFTGKLKTPVKVAISSMFNGTNTYVNNKKIAVNYKYTNAGFWDVLDFDFIEGKGFNKQQVDNADRVAIITEDIKKQYFGDIASVVGKYIEADNINYRVLGVVKSVPVTDYMFYSDIYLPYTVSKGAEYKSTGYSGRYMAVLQAASASDVPKMKQEYDDLVKRIPPERKDFNQLHSHANSFIYAFLDTGNEGKSGVMIVVTAISIFVFIFTLLPTLNLVNINITRILERSSEIGVRKAFGASSKTLVYQFIVENLILTLLGGILGTLLAGIALYAINHADLIANLELSINFTVLFIGVLLCVVFGLISGVYPAWRMSKLNVVTALKAQ